jgi:hypothetical protein
MSILAHACSVTCAWHLSRITPTDSAPFENSHIPSHCERKTEFRGKRQLKTRSYLLIVAICARSCGCCESCTMVAAGGGGTSSVCGRSTDDDFSVLRWGGLSPASEGCRSGGRTEDDYRTDLPLSARAWRGQGSARRGRRGGRGTLWLTTLELLTI